jgi:hypothetical protein
LANLTKIIVIIKRLPTLRDFAKAIRSRIRAEKKFPGSEAYWHERYIKGGLSGAGSYNRLAIFKAEVINYFVAKNEISSVIEFGCGDGNQLKLAQYKVYIGFDVSSKAIDICRETFLDDHSKTFKLAEHYINETADLTISLDVIYHLIENSVFDLYMRRLFSSAKKFVIIYSSNDEKLNESNSANHVKHRKFTDWVETNAKDWMLLDFLPNKYPYDKSNRNHTSFADFYFFGRSCV